ncbi:hypothetical protein CY0110_16727 [Crocosphaera chwakensis CCY0110]|uniref:Uncharacterized protein n=1 Tax=Crocosphaera chwakensis CCY0110 TaxID=391612 RepID=A3II27_9CHRO|nr:hypothetical protein CY0110_16727 [Crocosphaera chwakensis CCY0110]
MSLCFFKRLSCFAKVIACILSKLATTTTPF